MFGYFLKYLRTFKEICGYLLKLRMEISTDFRKLPEILRGLKISRNFHSFPFSGNLKMFSFPITAPKYISCLTLIQEHLGQSSLVLVTGSAAAHHPR